MFEISTTVTWQMKMLHCNHFDETNIGQGCSYLNDLKSCYQVRLIQINYTMVDVDLGKDLLRCFSFGETLKIFFRQD